MAAILADARDPWWVIGSAAVALLGVETDVADIDVLLSTADADAVDRRLGLGLRRDAGDGRFASTRYGRWLGPSIPIELMADTAIFGQPLHPATRMATTVDGALLYHPSLREMIAILDRFGRPKDLARAAMLRRVGTGRVVHALQGCTTEEPSMADNRLTIDPATLFDNADARAVEFSGDLGGERRDLAVQYDVLEALDGAAPDAGPVAAFDRHRDAIEVAATAALAREGDQDRVTISETDLA